MADKIFIVATVAVLFFLASCNDNESTNITSSARDTISVKLTMNNLPDTITYSKSTTPDYQVDYSWGVTFDINNDGMINQGDIILQILHYKSPGDTEQVGSIDDLESNVWLYTSDTAFESIAAVNKEIAGNSIIFTVDRSTHETLSKITPDTLVYFSTSYFDENNQIPQYDFYPSFSIYVNIPADGKFIDDTGDVTFPVIDMVSMEINL